MDKVAAGKRGGASRAAKLSSAEKTEIASAAAAARWGTPKATHLGTLEIGGMSIPCAVLENGLRVLSTRALHRVFGTGNPGRGSGRSGARTNDDFDLPPTLRSPRLAPFISEELASTLKTPIRYRSPAPHGGWVVARGFEAKLIPDLCEVWLKAREAGVLHYRQEPLAQAAEVLVRGLANVGIVALVDEVTGYVRDHNRRELHVILEAYIAPELLPWTKRFPDEFYKEMFRLRGWSYDPKKIARPQYIGKLTNVLVYKKLPRGVFDELRVRNPTTTSGRRRHRHHQFLTSDVGNPHLDRHIAIVTAMMRGSPTWETFRDMFRRSFPEKGDQLQLAHTTPPALEATLDDDDE